MPQNKFKTDVLISGCGIAGGMLASLLAREDIGVTVCEKRPSVGVPVRCGEAAGSREELSRFVDVDEKWISADINGARLVGPGGKVLERKLPGVGVVLKRDIFDQSLASAAASRGADIITSCELTDLLHGGGAIKGARVRFLNSGETAEIEASVTVGADGIESFVGRKAGIKPCLRPEQIHSCCEYVMQGEMFPEDSVWIFAGNNTAPGGYAWVFPKGNGMANVGVGIISRAPGKKTARERLDDFVLAHFPKAHAVKVIAGATSGLKPLKTITGDGVMLIGEAAGHNNPFSGGGIMNALESAEEAASIIINALRSRDVSRRSLGRFDDSWHERNGKTLARFASLRKFFISLNDKEMDAVINALDVSLPEGSLHIADYAGFFRRAFISTPGLLWKAKTLLW